MNQNAPVLSPFAGRPVGAPHVPGTESAGRQGAGGFEVVGYQLGHEKFVNVIVESGMP